MHHPGPPRFTSVGESVELAPRNPDRICDDGGAEGGVEDQDDAPVGAGDGSFRWRLADRPVDSDAAVDPGQGSGAVSHLTPDEPGVYVAELEAPEGVHEQVVRAFPDVRHEATFRVADEDVEGDVSDADRVSVLGAFNDFTMGTHRARRENGAWVLDASLPPGDHDAIFAFDDSFDPYARAEVTVEGPERPRVRLDARRAGDDREDDEVVVTATARAAPDGDEAPRVEFHLDGRDGLSWDDVTVDGDELRFPGSSMADGGVARIHAVPVAERHGIADTLSLTVDGEDGGGTLGVDRPADAPGWVRDATIYQIFVREFAGETVDTTFREIARRVEYVASLGVDTVWLTPVVASPTRHGYHATDLFDTAADLGTRAEFESMVERFHEFDIRVVFDLVVNHTSRDHPAFQLHRAGVPGYEDHYERVPVEENATDVDWAGDDAPGVYFNWTQIPNLNYDSLAVRRWMLDVIDEWAPVVDGFRCDVAWGVPHGFWKEVRERLKAASPEFLLLDETVPRRVGFRENEFDLHYDTDLYYALRDVGTGDAPATALLDALGASAQRGYPDEAVHMRYVENHDEERYATECDEGTLRPAAAATFTLPGAPLIYYGQERGVPEQRGTMRWHDGDAALTDYHRRLVALRTEEPALRADGVEPVGVEVVEGGADGDGVGAGGAGTDPATDRVVAYERSGAGESASVDAVTDPLVVVLHFDSGSVTVRLDYAVDTTDLLTGTDVAAGDDGALRVEDAVVLRGRPSTGN
ncbi:alpha-amylase family glycosyl hydrolase [Halobium salinum]|uniref:Alpha-amylase family glycosyl hydrolase n=1 Tax=Halobium salinum TaxID=1364940 RepID=A0ABD5PBW8_9EURY|nr:alpha-amylase family glycosyl hydrolase [Halobium salinum]